MALEDSLSLADLVEGRRFEEFAYRYRGPNGTVQEGFTSAGKIKRYVDFLVEELHVLDSQLRPVPAIGTLDENRTADLAKARLATLGVGVTAVRDEGRRILRDENPTLPTPERIYRALGPDVSMWRFRWLLTLYTSGETALVRVVQRQLVLPRSYGP
jgi:hypothetical protein